MIPRHNTDGVPVPVKAGDLPLPVLELTFYKGCVKLFSECTVGTVDAIMYDACAGGLLMGVGDDMTLAAAKSSIHQ